MHIWTLEFASEEKSSGTENSLPQALISSCRTLLSEDELARADRFLFDRDRCTYILAHALCRLMLSRFADIEPADWLFGKEQKGRPFIETSLQRSLQNRSLDFNLSHTLGMVGCAVSLSGKIGFDLEPKNRQAEYEALAERQFSKMEQQQLKAVSAAEKQQTFFRFWTLKESYIKLTGMGLSENLGSFGFDLATEFPECYRLGNKLQDMQFGLFDAGEQHQAAWAYQPEKLSTERIAIDLTQFSLEAFHALF